MKDKKEIRRFAEKCKEMLEEQSGMKVKIFIYTPDKETQV